METTDRKDIQTVAEDYFSSQNFINKKILEDVSEVRSEYGDSLWSRMSVGERDEVRKELGLSTKIDESSESIENIDIGESFLTSISKYVSLGNVSPPLGGIIGKYFQLRLSTRLPEY